jgi:hypothetical protein
MPALTVALRRPNFFRQGCLRCARRMVALAYAKVHLRLAIWFEYVCSEDNWSDGLSRLLHADPFCRKLGLVPEPLEVDIPRGYAVCCLRRHHARQGGHLNLVGLDTGCLAVGRARRERSG